MIVIQLRALQPSRGAASRCVCGLAGGGPLLPLAMNSEVFEKQGDCDFTPPGAPVGPESHVET